MEKELQITRDYLDLQTMRYGDKFKYRFEVDNEVTDCMIPKMTLQPLVENAIYHGLKYKEDWGTIVISGRKDCDLVLITVNDDGAGMDEDKLLLMQDYLKKNEIPKDEDRKHFGVFSVDHRLRLYFGEEYGIDVDSIKDKGTSFSIKMPLKAGE